MNRIEKMSPFMRKAVIKTFPSYFSLESHDQEEFAVNLEYEDVLKIKKILIEEYYGKRFTTREEFDDYEDQMTDDQYLTINKQILCLTGYGDDLFFLNESMSGPITQFKTLHDYAYHDHLYQNEALAKDFPNAPQRPYTGRLYHRWARLFINDVFHYANLSTLAETVYSECESLIFDIIKEYIPYEFVPGPDHGKKSKFGTIYDMVEDANGQELLLEDFKSHSYRYMNDLYDRLSEKYDKEAAGVVFIDFYLKGSMNDENSVDYVFSDKSILPNINFKTFHSDCKKNQQPYSVVEEEIDDFKNLVKNEMNDLFEKTKREFNPNVRPFKKPKQIVMSDHLMPDIDNDE